MEAQPQFEQEVSFAVVLYGGVSLAIYINGAVQEIRNLVRATSGEPLTDAEKAGPIPIYQRLASVLERGAIPTQLPQEGASMHTRFRVDIISGTSAGGINGVFLAKSLANNVPMTSLQDLWFREGAIEILLNDKQSYTGVPLNQPAQTQSLLNSRRMYLKLLEAFDNMDGADRSRPTSDGTVSPLADEIDLFVTTTDIRGVPVPIQLSDNVVFERRYRNDFNFRFAGGRRNDFQADNNPFLAFASRCTSSFPFAFEPMQLSAVDEILSRNPIYARRTDCLATSERWQKFYSEYTQPEGSGKQNQANPPIATAGPDASSEVNRLKAAREAEQIEAGKEVERLKGARESFSSRPFGDGGYLNNAPFSYAVDALVQRQYDMPTIRKLIYVEPSPAHPEDVLDPAGAPNAFENSLDALITIPGYQTTRGDLTRVLERNRAVTKINKLLAEAEQEIERQAKSMPELEKKAAEFDLLDGVGSRAYYRMRSSELTDLITRMIARMRLIDEDSAYFVALRSLVKGWRDKIFAVAQNPKPGEADGLKEFLQGFDLPYRQRRLRFLARKLDGLYDLRLGSQNAAYQSALTTLRFADISSPQLPAKLQEVRSQAANSLAVLRELMEELLERPVPGTPAPSSSQAAKPDLYGRNYVADILPRREDIISILDEILEIGPDDAPGQLYATRSTARRPGETGDMETICDLRASNLLADPELLAQLKHLGDTLRYSLTGVLDDVDTEMKAAFARCDTAGQLARRLYLYFDLFDAIQYPMMFGTNVVASETVDILRIAPEDAKRLIPDDVQQRRNKLKGLVAAHFGAFLAEDWRVSDLLWGRLDAAERLITTLLPWQDSASLRDEFIDQAHHAILAEFQVPARLKQMALRQALAPGPENKVTDHSVASLLQAVVPPATAQFIDQNQGLMQVWQNVLPAEMNRRAQLQTVARSTTIVGQMMEAIAAQSKLSNAARWLTNGGRALWGVVEISVPGSLSQHLGDRGQTLLLLMSALLILAGALSSQEGIAGVGWSLFGVFVVLFILTRVLGSYLRAAWPWRALLTLLGTVVLLFFAIGVWRSYVWVVQETALLHKRLGGFF